MIFELPTTGAVTFSDFCDDPKGIYTAQISNATAARSALRACLKENKRRSDEKDYLRLVKIIDDYLPYLYSLISSVNELELALRTEPELAFTLLTYAFALCNLAKANVSSLGNYEHERHITDAERKANDEKLNFAVNLLCRASGVFVHIAEKVVVAWPPSPDAHPRPPDVSREVTTALSKLALADAQVLAIRKLMTKSAYDSIIRPGPPLPKSHPSPILVAKLHFEASELYGSARSLAKTPAHASGQTDVAASLRRYLANAIDFHSAQAHEWLGVDAGEAGRSGEAVAFLTLAQSKLGELSSRKAREMVSLGKSKEAVKQKKEKTAQRLNEVEVFLKHYKRINDSLHFLPVPTESELRARIPAGRIAVALKPYTLPVPKFGPGTVGYMEHQLQDVGLVDGEPERSQGDQRAGYAGAGSYF